MSSTIVEELIAEFRSVYRQRQEDIDFQNQWDMRSKKQYQHDIRMHYNPKLLHIQTRLRQQKYEDIDDLEYEVFTLLEMKFRYKFKVH